MLENKVEKVETKEKQDFPYEEPDIEKLSIYDPRYKKMARNLFFPSVTPSQGILTTKIKREMSFPSTGVSNGDD
ncbi:MAG: hypothetical protein QF632_02560 [Candidatus Woesearchaeota archaeon]|jgi:hypothetical protein|nr:hypothetical protein [Candidatus Woesearchaeota archaeon]MDP7323618.1 hypothetical protein [Candidatus Woesearchaeota archaeon]MDP7458522.1 hypothetical protein [Candidatus Woesearchaeota archaeon]